MLRKVLMMHQTVDQERADSAAATAISTGLTRSFNNIEVNMRLQPTNSVRVNDLPQTDKSAMERNHDAPGECPIERNNSTLTFDTPNGKMTRNQSALSDAVFGENFLSRCITLALAHPSTSPSIFQHHPAAVHHRRRFSSCSDQLPLGHGDEDKFAAPMERARTLPLQQPEDCAGIPLARARSSLCDYGVGAGRGADAKTILGMERACSSLSDGASEALRENPLHVSSGQPMTTDPLASDAAKE